MFRLARVVLVTTGAMAMLTLLNVATADAITCKSACSQIRRACVHVAHAAQKVEQAVCDEARDTCRVDCETADPALCLVGCDSTNAACVSACGADLICQAGCATALSDCTFGCLNCKSACNDARATCRDVARIARGEAKLACSVTREMCPDLCVEPIDGDCVRQCKVLQRGCKKAAQGFYGQCKKACAKGTGKRACMGTCKKQYNAALQLCSAQEALCVGGCIGLTP